MSNRGRSALLGGELKAVAVLLLTLSDFGRAGVNSAMPLSSVEEVADLTNDRAHAGIPVRLQAAVAYYDHDRFALILTGGGRSVYITGWHVNLPRIQAGDIVGVEGVTQLGAFKLRVRAEHLAVVGHGPIPSPRRMSLAEAIQPSRNSEYVEAEGRVVLVQAGDHLMSEMDFTIVRLLSGNATVDLSLHAPSSVSMRSWLGRRMRFRGISGGLFNSRRQRYQAIVYVRSLQDLELVGPDAAPTVGDASALTLASLFEFDREMPRTIRTSGVVSYVKERNSFYVQDGNSGIEVRPAHPVDLAPGDEVEITGRPEWEGAGQSVLSGALVTPAGARRSLNAQPYHRNELGLPATEALLTDWEGWVVDQSAEGWRESLTVRPITRDSFELPTFQCAYFRGDAGASFPRYEIGSRIKARGVLKLEWSPAHYLPLSAQMLVGGPEDISLIARPPWQSRFPWLQVFWLLAVGLMGAVAWVWTLRRRVAERTFDLKGAVVRAEAASLAKSEFLANMSHEIRTPMNGILGMTEMVLASPLTKDQRSFLETAYGSAQILLAVVNDILDLSKIQAGMMTIESTEFNLPRAISGALSPFGIQASEKGIELCCHLAPSLPELVLGDPVRTRQIISNLMSNAMKFTQSGEVIVSARLTGQAGGDESGLREIEISVRDTGIGIPQEKQHLLFESFSQADASVARRFGGTGLGLAISSRLAQAMGGRIWVESKPDVGSTFTFTMQVQQSLESEPAPSPKLRLAAMRALVVDDHPTSRSFLASSLADLGMDSDEAKNGTDALELLSAGKRFEFVIADHHMPGMTGSRFFQIAKENGWLWGFHGETKCLTLCSGPPPDDVCRESRILLKPTATWELAEALAGMLDEGERVRADSRELSEAQSVGLKEGLRVLVAEDNVDSRKLMEVYMTRGGYDAVVVENGKEAVTAWESGDFSLILMDGQMPEMDGLEAAACIRERERGRNSRIPIIALTAYAQETDRKRFLDSGMTDYLTKPVAYSDLMAAIDRCRGVEAE